jgi:hypothetical protein
LAGDGCLSASSWFPSGVLACNVMHTDNNNNKCSCKPNRQMPETVCH